LFFAFAGTEVANIKSDNQGSNSTTGESTGFNLASLIYISLSFGFSLMVKVWVFFRISGSIFNPAVTLGMVMVKAITVVRGICLLTAQMTGAIIASAVVRYLFPESFNVRTTLGGGASLAQGVFIEGILTAELVFTIFMLAKEKHRATFIAPVGIGLALFIAELVGVQFTGGSLNPARSFGPCAITGKFDEEHWIYCKHCPLRVFVDLTELTSSTRYWTLCRIDHRSSILPIYQDFGIRGETGDSVPIQQEEQPNNAILDGKPRCRQRRSPPFQDTREDCRESLCQSRTFSRSFEPQLRDKEVRWRDELPRE
jgi:glycerol uptake facilitator-like aquaporin